MGVVLNQFKTVLLLSALTGLMLVVGGAIGGQNGLFVALVFALCMNVFSYYFSDKLVLKMYRAQEVTKKSHPKLYAMVADVTKRAHVPMPKVYIIPGDTPNAFATGRNPDNAAVACTEGIIKLLSEKELRGVIAHEVAHIKNRDILIATIAATIAGVISYIAMMARWAAFFGGGRDREGSGNMFGMLALAILTPFIAMIIQLAISRSREYIADATGAQFIEDPESLASALEKLESGNERIPFRSGNTATSSLFIVNPFSGHSFISLFSTHPPMKERIRRLRNMKF